MPKLVFPVQWMPVLVLAASIYWPLTLAAAPVVIDIENYVVSVGRRSDYFDGKLLTAGDLSGDQEYKRGTDRLLGDPAQVLGDATLTLDDLFSAAGRGDVRLSFDCFYTDCVGPREPVNLQDPHHDDMIFLDPDGRTWFGRLYLQGVQGIDDGVYDVRSGSFDQFAAVDEPASTALVGLALVGLLAVRRSRVRGPVMPKGTVGRPPALRMPHRRLSGPSIHRSPTMPAAEAQKLVAEVMTVRRSHPHAPALDVLDLVMKGGREMPESDAITPPPAPFALVVVEAFDRGMTVDERRQWTVPPACSWRSTRSAEQRRAIGPQPPSHGSRMRLRSKRDATGAPMTSRAFSSMSTRRILMPRTYQPG